MILAVGALAAGPAVGAQEVQESTTSAPTTTTTAVPRTTGESTTTALPPSTGTSAPDPSIAVAEETAIAEAPPAALTGPPVTVPPPAVPPPPPTPEQEQLALAMAARLDQASLGLRVALGLEVRANGALRKAKADHAAAQAKLATAEAAEREASAELTHQRDRLRRWAVEAYVGGNLRRLTLVLEIDQANDLPRRIGLVEGTFGGLAQDLGDQEKELDSASAERRQSAETVASAGSALDLATKEATAAKTHVLQRRREVTALGAGKTVSLGGVAFPVSGSRRYSDTFGAPRMEGTQYAHAHEGVDIFAPAGAPVVAFERGVVAAMGTDVLGGTKLWLVGQTGTRYYYAHLQGFAPGLANSQVVEAGQTLGFVGDTGNAAGSPHHLHFEIHIAGGPAVNPYPIVAEIDRAEQVGAARAGAAKRP